MCFCQPELIDAADCTLRKTRLPELSQSQPRKRASGSELWSEAHVTAQPHAACNAAELWLSSRFLSSDVSQTLVTSFSLFATHPPTTAVLRLRQGQARTARALFLLSNATQNSDLRHSSATSQRLFRAHDTHASSLSVRATADCLCIQQSSQGAFVALSVSVVPPLPRI